MTADALLQLQKAAYDALVADNNLNELITGIYIYVPETATYPYLLLSEGTSSSWSNLTTQGNLLEFTVQAHVRDRSSKPVMDILAAIYAVLHRAALTVTGQTLFSLEEIDSTIRRGADGLSYIGISTYRARTQQS